MAKTIYDIAEAAGVSIATVSRSFSNSKGVTEKTRERVLKIAEELGYHPQGFAQSLAKKKRNALTVVVPVISNYFFMELLAGIQDQLKNLDFELNIVNVKSDEDLFNQIKFHLKRRWSEGYIFISIHINDQEWKSLEKFGIPIVIIDDYYHNFDSVSIDNEKGAYEATLYLAKKGYRDIAMLSAAPYSKPIILRKKGYQHALNEAGLKFYEKNIVQSSIRERDGFTEAAGYEAMKKILEMKPIPEACFSASDIQSVGAMKAMRDTGIRIPLISYDNLTISEFLDISTVAQPMYKMGRDAVRKLVDRLENRNKPVSHTIYSPDLIIRKSSEINSNQKN